MNKSVVLIGMAYSGKSTVGPLLARQLLLEYLDTDHLIQAQEGMSLQAIIDTKGSETFREIEESCVCELATRQHVIATGGSVVYSDAAMRHLQSLGRIVWLDVPLPILASRATHQGTRGLVIAPGMSFADLYRERLPLYKKWGAIRIDTAGQIPAETAHAIAASL